VTDKVVLALDAELLAVLRLFGDLDESDFSRSTNCPPWTLKDLAAHINGTILLPLSWRLGRPPRRTAADYYRRPERFTNEYRQHNVQQTQRASAQYQSGTDVVRQLTRTREEVIGRLELEDLRRVVDIANVGAMTVQDLVATRVLAVTAHAIDVAITLERTPAPSQGALEVCTPIITDLLGGPPPAALHWTPADFFTRATGRSPLDPSDTELLGAAASRFPLIN
jgi:uncharacterized protein (TIGR03083 family)